MLQTERLKIYTASDDEMKKLIAGETDSKMRTAYQKMLESRISHPVCRMVYGTERKRIGD